MCDKSQSSKCEQEDVQLNKITKNDKKCSFITERKKNLRGSHIFFFLQHLIHFTKSFSRINKAQNKNNCLPVDWLNLSLHVRLL